MTVIVAGSECYDSEIHARMQIVTKTFRPSCFDYHLLMFQYQHAIVTFRPCELSVFVSHIFFLTVVHHMCGWVGMLAFKTLTRITHSDSHRSWVGMLLFN